MRAVNAGFTLLEVIVAMAIVSTVLGTAFSLFAGSKRLAFKASEEVGQVIFLRAALNSAQALEKPEYPEFPEQYRKHFTLQADKILEAPLRQTEKIMLGLEPYTFESQEQGMQLSTVRWKKLQAVQ